LLLLEVFGVTPTLTGPRGQLAGPSTFPELSFEEVQAEWCRFAEFLATGCLDPGGTHAGQYVAFFENRVMGYGADPVELRRATARDNNIHPERVVISYLDA